MAAGEGWTGQRVGQFDGKARAEDSLMLRQADPAGGIRSLIPTCTFRRGRRHTVGQKGNGPGNGERFFGPPCSGREFPLVSKGEVGWELRLAILTALSDGVIDVLGARLALRSGCSWRGDSGQSPSGERGVDVSWWQGRAGGANEDPWSDGFTHPGRSA